MAKRIIAFFAGGIGNRYLTAAILAVIPVTEIKGSILYAVASGTNAFLSFLAAYASSLLLCLSLSYLSAWAVKRIERSPRLKKATAFLLEGQTRRAEKFRYAEKGEEAREKRMLAVFLFVALPLPMTGVWAGSILAAMLGLGRKESFFALATGNFTAGGIVLAVAIIAGERAGLVLDLFLLLSLFLVLLAFLRKKFSHKYT